MTQYSHIWGTEAAERRRPCAVRTPTPRPCPGDAPGRATARAGALGSARHSPWRPALRCVPDGAPVPQSGRPPPPLAREAAPVTGARSRAGAPGPVCACRHPGVGTDVQDPGGVTPPTGLQGHRDDRRCDCRRLPWGTLLPQQRPPRAALCAAAVPWLALSGPALAHDGGPVTVRTGQDLEKHQAMRSRGEESLAETRVERSPSTPVRHLPAVVLTLCESLSCS